MPVCSAITLCYSCGIHSCELGDCPQNVLQRESSTTSRYSRPWRVSPGLVYKQRRIKPGTEMPQALTAYGVWVARCSMIAVFSLPLFATWSMTAADLPVKIRFFRLVLTLVAAFFLGVMVFVRQQLLDRELVELAQPFTHIHSTT